MKDCLFCKIIAKEIPCFKIYEDEFCLAFLDIANDVYGHTLIIPKRHYENVLTCDNTTLSKVLETCKKIGSHYVKDCGFDGFGLTTLTGEAAGQSIKHVHFHIVPRFKDKTLEESDLSKVCETLKLEEQEEHFEVPKDTMIIYTDGACSGNPGAGGWGTILLSDGKEQALSGGEANTTNNRMELMAVINGLENADAEKKIQVYSDSAYIVNAFNLNWIENWKRNNWQTSTGGEVQNKDLWQRLLRAKQGKDVTFNKVKGHSDSVLNNRCDALARFEAAKFSN